MSDVNSQIQIPQDYPEVWEGIPGYIGIYEISSLGRVRTLTRRKSIKAGYIFRLKPHKSGYFYADLTDRNGNRKKCFVHRLMMLAFHPIDNPDDMDVNHKDGQKGRNVLSNLEWLSHQANIIHARDVLKVWADNRGEKSGKSKLMDEDIRQIRRLWNNGQGMQQTEIAKLYHVSSVSISNICNRRTWAHVE